MNGGGVRLYCKVLTMLLDDTLGQEYDLGIDGTILLLDVGTETSHRPIDAIRSGIGECLSGHAIGLVIIEELDIRGDRAAGTVLEVGEEGNGIVDGMAAIRETLDTIRGTQESITQEPSICTKTRSSGGETE